MTVNANVFTEMLFNSSTVPDEENVLTLVWFIVFLQNRSICCAMLSQVIKCEHLLCSAHFLGDCGYSDSDFSRLVLVVAELLTV